jgi:site-specific DNA recombinase
MRAVIYARFSSDLQDNRSITDQVSLARKYGETRGFALAGVYEDAAISGASLINRPGLQRLLVDAAAQKFNVLVTESLDRLSRSQADIAALYERLCFLGVRIETLADGHVSEIHVGLKGTMSALFLKDLAQKTRRGQMGRVKAGRIPGGRSYGYDMVLAGEDRGQRVLNIREAAIVRRIYTEYASGKGSLAIVKGLNFEGEPGPSGGAWNVSALVGSPKRRNGLLNNELYRGTIVYNRQRFVKDPATGKRVSRGNPESEWQRQDVPELRIVDEELWARVQRLRESRGGPHIHHQRGPKRLLSGLIYCGCCGARYNIASRDFLRCSAKSNSGTCDRSRLVRMAEVEQRVLASLERNVLTERMFELAASAYRDEFARAQGDRGAMRARLDAELTDVQKKFDRLLKLVEEGHADAAVAGPRLNELATKKRSIAGELALRPDDAPAIPVGDGAASYRKLVEGLRLKTLGAESDEQKAAILVRELVRRIVVLPRDEDEVQGLEIEAGTSPIGVTTDHDCNVGCGGLHWATQPSSAAGGECLELHRPARNRFCVSPRNSGDKDF